MKITHKLIILLSCLLSLSCGDNRQDNAQSLSVSLEEMNGRQQKDSVQLVFNKMTKNSDSLEIKLKYFTVLDTIKLSREDQRFKFLYITYKDVTLDKLEESVKNDDWTGINKEDIKVFELDKANSTIFYFDITLEKNNKIKGVVDDIVFLKNYNEKGETRIIHHVTKFEEKIN